MGKEQRVQKKISKSHRASRQRPGWLTIGLIVVAVVVVGTVTLWPRPKAASVDAARLALGLPGFLLGGTPLVQNRVKRIGRGNLEKFIQAHPQYQ